MHEDEVNREIEKFNEAAKNKGILKVPMEFPPNDNLPDEYFGSEMDFGKPEYVKVNKEKALEVDQKKKKKGIFER